ncbi:MAG: hypothetical protein II804_05645 [Clostridia bacterium]|nr:hypothetical protein [Clostridia bacterium]
MKKLCAIFLAALMLLTVLPMAAFAKVGNDDKIIDEILNGSFQHMTYTQDNKYFKSVLTTYAVFHADDWGDQIEGNTYEAKAAKATLLALIDKIEAELNNETYKKILSVLQGASTAAGIVEKVDSVTRVLKLAENSTWATSLGVLNGMIKAGNLANEQYENYMEGYAIILSCQAASSYYGKLLDYIAANVEDSNIAAAATELKAKMTMKLDEANEALIQEMIDDVGKEGVLIGINAAMSTNSVTAAINTAYNLIGSIADKLFNATDACTYASTLAALTRMEDKLPTYIEAQIQSGDEYAADFAKISLLTLRESGEAMLSNFSTVIKDNKVISYFKNTDQANALSRSGAIAATKLSVYHDIILDDATHTTYESIIDTTAGKNITIRNKDRIALATMRSGRESKLLNEDGAFYSVYNSNIKDYIRVAVPFQPDCYSELSKPTSSGSGSSSSGSSSSGGGFFAQLFAAIAAFFRSLFSFGK